MSNPNPKNQFKPGNNANPTGRPKKGYSITEWFKEFLEANPKAKTEIAEAIRSKAAKGDMAAIKLLWNYMDGLPTQKTDITSKGEKLEGLVITKTK